MKSFKILNFDLTKIFISSFVFLSTHSYSNVNVEVSRDSYLFSESKNSKIFKLNVILKDNNKVIFKDKLGRGNSISYNNLEGKKYNFVIEFESHLKGKTENKYILNLSDPGLYKITLGKKNEKFTSSLVKPIGKKFAYMINGFNFVPYFKKNEFNEMQENSQTLKTSLRNLTLLYEQEIINKQEYLERRQLLLSKSSK
ncbi:hypothetical protein OAQ75_02510 [Gammaproteobacteria bacterium]|nr:hypothetical protein [Gammaproteobacteria bacterium]